MTAKSEIYCHFLCQQGGGGIPPPLWCWEETLIMIISNLCVFLCLWLNRYIITLRKTHGQIQLFTDGVVHIGQCLSHSSLFHQLIKKPLNKMIIFSERGGEINPPPLGSSPDTWFINKKHLRYISCNMKTNVSFSDIFYKRIAWCFCVCDLMDLQVYPRDRIIIFYQFCRYCFEQIILKTLCHSGVVL